MRMRPEIPLRGCGKVYPFAYRHGFARTVRRERREVAGEWIMMVFWAIGIGISVLMLAALVWWVVSNWTGGDRQ